MKNLYLTALLSITFFTNVFSQIPTLNGKIVYHTYSGYENWDGEIFILDLSDNSVTNISSGWNIDHEINAMFSPDGNKIVFMGDIKGDGQRNWDIFLWTIGGGQPVNLTPYGGRDEDPKFSPDGTKIVYKSDNDILIMDLQGNLLSNVTNTPNIEESMPYYTVDGSKILFAPGAGSESDIYSINVNGTNRQPVVSQSNYQEYYPITRDNESFFYTGWVNSFNLNDQVFLKYDTSSTSVYLPFNTTNANYSDATPAGLQYAILSSTKNGGKGGYDLYIADINTGDIWSLDDYNNNVNNAYENLGANYLPSGTLSLNKSKKRQIKVSLYPNPILQERALNIQIQDSQIQYINFIQVINMQGQILKSILLENESHVKIEMNYPKGIYFVKINQGDITHVEKIIIN
ncbi:T9SS type A sorting domain-containing protein [Flavivirga sp. 57AJ16]|uniref:T9SS type A sorting domain-containing protein n=1 Tax=Flavivirga sp. 57AJ16 TaxID=3025307 RepID=UPI002365AB3B|nr:T9SS type A sorting domain-containing protein [Flavivirga sp. 57AJ16]MDD7885078.1 T9SS type A sorting domain-containing protein [Flavivirga sp. 57AJ16]